jgi:glycosyltransferase involved in cell wall biosynthesis
LRLMSTYYPENQYLLFTPRDNDGLFTPDASTCKTVLPNRFIDKKLPSWWRSRGITNDLNQYRPDIYHGLSQELPAGIAKTGIKSVVTLHDAIFIRYPELYDPFYRTIFTLKNRYSCKVADRIIAISEQTKRDAIEFFGADESKIDVVYQGCNNIFRQVVSSEAIDEVKKRHNLPESFLLCVGAIETRKNQLLIIEAIHRGGIDIPVVLIGGKTKYLEIVEKKIREYSLDKQIVVLNNISTVELPFIYHAASCFVYPSIFEGFGIPILEALCSGTPVITSKGSCFPESGGEAALYIDPYSPDDLAEKISLVLDNSDVREEMIRKGTIQAAKFADDKVAQQVNNIYSTLR